MGGPRGVLVVGGVLRYNRRMAESARTPLWGGRKGGAPRIKWGLGNARGLARWDETAVL